MQILIEFVIIDMIVLWLVARDTSFKPGYHKS